MDQLTKLSLLSENMDVENQDLIINHSNTNILNGYPSITYANISGGKKMPLLKSMITSICERNCYYCAFRAGRDCRRASFKPDEMANTFLELHRKRMVEGLFLSSGLAGGSPYIQNKIIDTAKILRKNYNFQGYLHLKVMPGAEKDQIKELMKYADRISINLEAPNEYRLASLSPQKDFYSDLFTRLQWINEIRNNMESNSGWKNRLPSISTQFVVGPSLESDRELLLLSSFLINEFKLSRIYFMTFRPVKNTPFEDLLPEDPHRGKRLYQASFLIRDYKFKPGDFSFLETGNLDLTRDPKRVWADNHLRETPLEINRATKEELIRIPGIGLKRAEEVIQYRRMNKISSISDISNLGIPLNRASEFILINGRRPEYQLKLF